MKTSKIIGLGFAATAAISLLAVGASAQQPPPATSAPAKVVPKTTPPPPPVKADAPVTAPKTTVAKAAEPSPCKGLVEAACKAKADVCGWIVPTKIDAKTGAADKAYCRKVAGIAKKAAPTAAPKVDAKAAAPKAAEKPVEKAAVKAVVPKATTKAVPPPAATK